jgi:hypothetical protein
MRRTREARHVRAMVSSGSGGGPRSLAAGRAAPDGDNDELCGPLDERVALPLDLGSSPPWIACRCTASGRGFPTTSGSAPWPPCHSSESPPSIPPPAGGFRSPPSCSGGVRPPLRSQAATSTVIALPRLRSPSRSPATLRRGAMPSGAWNTRPGFRPRRTPSVLRAAVGLGQGRRHRRHRLGQRLPLGRSGACLRLRADDRGLAAARRPCLGEGPGSGGHPRVDRTSVGVGRARVPRVAFDRCPVL